MVSEHRSLYISNSRILIPILVICFVLFVPSYIYREIISANSFSIVAERGYYKGGHKAKRIFVGNSHLMYLLDKVDQSEIYNYSLPAMEYIQIYYLLKYLIEETDHSFDTVILPLSIESFVKSTYEHKFNSFFWSRYIDYMELARIENRYQFYFMQYIKDRFFPYLGQWDTIKKFMTGNDIHVHHRVGAIAKLGKTFDGRFPHRQREILEERLKALFPQNEIINPIILQYFYRSLDLCHQHGVKVILLKPPITFAFVFKIARDLDLQAYNKQIPLILERYPDIRYLDYQYLSREHDDLFSDADHLNIDGITEVNKLLIRDLKI